LKLAAGATTPTPLLTGLNIPTAVALDSVGNLYITDSGNNRVLMLPAG
jgi:serine/threonine protein kinase, bacterial